MFANKSIILGSRYFYSHLKKALNSIGIETSRCPRNKLEKILNEMADQNDLYTIIDGLDPSRGHLCDHSMTSKILNSRNLLLKKLEGNKYIYLSSGLVYKKTNELINESGETYNTSDYSNLKLKSEKLIEKYGSQGIIMRLTNLWSENSAEDTFMGSCISKKRKGEIIDITDTDEQTMIDLIYADDAANAIALSIKKNIPSGIYNISTAVAYKISDIKNYFANNNNLVPSLPSGRILSNEKILSYNIKINCLGKLLAEKDFGLHRQQS